MKSVQHEVRFPSPEMENGMHLLVIKYNVVDFVQMHLNSPVSDVIDFVSWMHIYDKINKLIRE